MQPKSSSKQFFRKVLIKTKIYFVIIVLALAIFFALINLNSYFQLKTIEIKGDVPKTKILGLESLKGTNLLLLSTNRVFNLINKNTPDNIVEEVIKKYPDKLILKLRTVEPIAQLPLNIGFAQLSDEAKILKKSKQKEVRLPVINFYQRFDYTQLTPGNILDYKEIVTSLSILETSRSFDLEVESIDINGLNMIVFNLKDPPSGEAGRKILLSAEKDLSKQIFELETLITQFKIKSQEFKILDLRFDKPVIKF